MTALSAAGDTQHATNGVGSGTRGARELDIAGCDSSVRPRWGHSHNALCPLRVIPLSPDAFSQNCVCDLHLCTVVAGCQSKTGPRHGPRPHGLKTDHFEGIWLNLLELNTKSHRNINVVTYLGISETGLKSSIVSTRPARLVVVAWVSRRGGLHWRTSLQGDRLPSLTISRFSVVFSSLYSGRHSKPHVWHLG